MHKNDKEIDIALLREDVSEQTEESGLFENALRVQDGYIITEKVRGV